MTIEGARIEQFRNKSLTSLFLAVLTMSLLIVFERFL